jgi:site-specific DNA-methyltransferase (adenine-specific)
LRAQRDESIDALITDPPYGTMDAAWDVGGFDIDRWWQLVKQKLKPAGVVVCFAAGRFLFQLQASNPRWYRYDLVWEKSVACGFLNAAIQPLRAHEQVLVFTPKLKASTYNAQKIATGRKASGAHRRPANRRSTLYRGHAHGFTWVDDGTRHPVSVLRFASVGRKDRLHPTQKPLDLVRWLVRTYSNAGDVVCDTFAGSATTAEACAIENRNFVGCERDPGFFEAATRRLAPYLGG